MQHVKNGLVTCSTWPLPRCCECMRMLRCLRWSCFILLDSSFFCWRCLIFHIFVQLLVLSWFGCSTSAWNEAAGLDIISVPDSFRTDEGKNAGCQSQSCRACWTAASVYTPYFAYILWSCPKLSLTDAGCTKVHAQNGGQKGCFQFQKHLSSAK